MYRYTSFELESFYDLLDRIVTDAAERELKLPVYDMIQRLFETADRGERDEGGCAKHGVVAPDAVGTAADLSQRYGQSTIERRRDAKAAA
jgi:hypothetical protein